MDKMRRVGRGRGRGIPGQMKTSMQLARFWLDHKGRDLSLQRYLSLHKYNFKRGKKRRREGGKTTCWDQYRLCIFNYR